MDISKELGLQDLEGEVWKEIEGFEVYYQVSNLGRVKSLERKIKHMSGFRTKKESIMIQTLTRFGYYRIKLIDGENRSMKLVHRIVLDAFLNNKNVFLEINHKNGIKTDNNLDNLEWVTRSENMKHAFKNGLNKSRDMKGENGANSKLKNKDVLKIRELLMKLKPKEIASIYGVSFSCVSKIKLGKRWGHI